MRLESVLSLKQELTGTLFPAVRSVRTWAEFPVPTRGWASLDEAHVRPPELVAVALGVACGTGRADYRLGARVQISGRAGRALAEQVLAAAQGEADVRMVPKIRKRTPPSPTWFRRRRRPLESGVSIGHFRITAGTLGFVVEDPNGYYALSNNHVLADLNAGAPGDPVIQPGPADIAKGRKVRSDTLVGVLDRFVPISFQRSNLVDAAVAQLLDTIEFFAGWTEALPGVVKGVKPATFDDLGRPVSKAGRTTGVRHGTITQVNVDRLQVDMGDNQPRIALFSDQIEVEGTGRPFSDGGDSGSVIVGKDGFAYALLFAGGPEESTGRDLTYANQLHVALQKLGVTLALA